VIGRLAYGVLWVVVIPIGLWRWAVALDPSFPLPAVHRPILGGLVASIGLALVLTGVAGLARHGDGLPMNPFPPTRLVRTGVYRWIGHPIYLGFAMVVVGWSLFVGSPAGLWLVSPVTALALAGLVVGYERHDLLSRFGPAALRRPRLALPPDDEGRPRSRERLSVIALVLMPWLLWYAAVQSLGRPIDAFVTTLDFERRWPVLEWTEALYASAYLLIPLTPLLLRTRRALRAFALQGIVATVVVGLCWVVVPVVAEHRPFSPQGFWGDLLVAERDGSAGVAAFPAFHVLWAWIAAEGWRANARTTGRMAWAWIGTSWALATTLSTLTTGMHSVIEVVAAMLLFVPIRRFDHWYLTILQAAERVANSWREWRLGPVRIINHGFFAAAAAVAGVLVSGTALGGGHETAVVWVALGALLGAGLLAQWLEGSSRLLRPFGWYGGVVGGALGAVVATSTGVGLLPLLAAYAVALPWIQMIGRMRCLVQGCCHGRPTDPAIGIRYHHRRSRVTQLAHLAGVSLHPTPLYSMAGNLVIGLVLFRLRMLGAPDQLVLGSYFIASGVARFVEESFRGEPQTMTLGGLRLYQWLGVATLLAGVGITLLPATAHQAGFVAPSATLLWATAGIAALSFFMMSIDFPASNRRFSRLAAAD
jgi:prolipoprotein diacylglyceryltransferase/protein-S-isoprenylcysteine O-methyltransferase Ste14